MKMFNQNKEKIEKSLEFGEIPGLEMLKDKVRVGRKTPLEYEEMKAKERKEVKQNKHDKARDLLINIIEYNNKNGRKTKLKLTENDNLKEIFGNLSESELYEVESVLSFAHDPIDDDPKRRGLFTIQDHDKMNYIIALLKKEIPGFAEQLAINKLKGELTMGEKKIKELEIERDKRRLEHKERIESRNLTTMPKLTKVETPSNKHICEFCGRDDFKSAGGKGSHMKTCDKKPKE